MLLALERGSHDAFARDTQCERQPPNVLLLRNAVDQLLHVSFIIENCQQYISRSFGERSMFLYFFIFFDVSHDLGWLRQYGPSGDRAADDNFANVV